MATSQELLKKWAPILESEAAPQIKDNYRKEVTAILLENQEQAMAQQARMTSDMLNETKIGRAHV